MSLAAGDLRLAPPAVDHRRGARDPRPRLRGGSREGVPAVRGTLITEAALAARRAGRHLGARGRGGSRRSTTRSSPRSWCTARARARRRSPRLECAARPTCGGGDRDEHLGLLCARSSPRPTCSPNPTSPPRCSSTTPAPTHTVDVLAPGTATTVQDLPGADRLLARGRAAERTDGRSACSSALASATASGTARTRRSSECTAHRAPPCASTHPRWCASPVRGDGRRPRRCRRRRPWWNTRTPVR